MASLRSKYKEVSWNVPGVFAKGQLTLITARSGVGKSMLLLRLAGCFTNGLKGFYDTPTLIHGSPTVVYLDFESAIAINLDRATMLGIDPSRILSSLDGFDEETVPNLTDPTFADALRSTVRAHGVALVIIDSLSAATAGLNENSAEMIAPLKMLSDLAQELGISIGVVHHTNKSSLVDQVDPPRLESVRGSSAIVQTPRLILALDKPVLNNENMIRVTTLKNSFQLPAKPFGYWIDEGQFVWMLTEGIVDSIKTSRRQAIELTEHHNVVLNGLKNGLAQRTIADNLGLSESKVSKLKKDLQDKGML